MQITVINKRPAGGMPVTCVDSVQCKPGETHVMPSRSYNDYVTQMGTAVASEILVRATLEASDYPPFLCVMKKPADPGSGVNTIAGEGYDLKALDGVTDAGKQLLMYLGVFTDAACTVPCLTGSFATATKGTINSGSGTKLITCTPDATGEFACTLTDTADETVYLKAWPAVASYSIDSSDSHSNTFIP